ncbi:MAG: hypothetical protein IAF94_05090 [Pirellulaceae bacterium]|nr:hypothetical protein [Pirellulaceae bacterium]
MDQEQIVEALLEQAASQDVIAFEAAEKAKKFREAASLLGSPSNGAGRLAIAPAMPTARSSSTSIRELVSTETSGRYRTIPEICEATGLERRQVTHALHSPKGRFERHVRRDGKPEFRLRVERTGASGSAEE